MKIRKIRPEIETDIAANNGYCPCQLLRNNDTKCMCALFKAQIARHEIGECPCGLYSLDKD